MITVRPADQRGRGSHGWLESRHTFSFADYHDSAHMGFRSLRVLNEDRVAPGAGFDTHPHRDMEIFSYVLAGRLQHRDSLGHGATILPGEVQRITAGTGIQHSEFNPSADEPVHFYQVWLRPDRHGHSPSYAQKAFPAAERTDRWQLILSPDGRDGSLSVQQDATIRLTDLRPGQVLSHAFAAGRHGWLQVLRGRVQLNSSAALSAGDGAAISDEPTATLTALGEVPAELMLFDLA